MGFVDSESVFDSVQNVNTSYEMYTAVTSRQSAVDLLGFNVTGDSFSDSQGPLVEMPSAMSVYVQRFNETLTCPVVIWPQQRHHMAHAL